MKNLAAVLFVLLVASSARAQQRWSQTYGGTANDAGYSVQQTSDTGYVVTGYTNSFGAGGEDVYLVKANASGDVAWSKAFGGLGGDYGYSVQQTSDGGYIIAGITLSFGAGFRDIYVIKTDASGDTLGREPAVAPTTSMATRSSRLWTEATSSPEGQAPSGQPAMMSTWSRRMPTAILSGPGDMDGSDEEGYSVQQTLDRGYIIAGYTTSFGAGRHDVYLIKTNANGDTVWTRTYGGVRCGGSIRPADLGHGLHHRRTQLSHRTEGL